MRPITHAASTAALAAALARPGDPAPQTAPKFAIDATWPKPLPEGWITGQLGGVCVDNRTTSTWSTARNITDEEKETSISAPSIIIFDMEGNVVGSWGD